MNYETNKIIFVCYPPGAGGKFLINCCGLSDNATLQHQNLIDYTKGQKKTFLYNQITGHDKSGPWKDLGLGCNELLGDLKLSGTLEHGAILGKLEVGLPFNDIGKQLSNQTAKDFFYVCHDEDTRATNMTVFPNAKQIHFINNEDFLKQRPGYQGFTDEVWKAETNLVWNTTWYENIDLTTWGIEQIYNKLGYTDFDSVYDFVREYYKLWIQKIR